MTSAESHRARAWVHSAQAAVCDVIEPWEHGTVIRATRYPTYFDLNLVRVEDDAELSVEDVVGVADKALAGLSHRHVGFEVPGAGERVRAGLQALGWMSELLLWMRHSGPSPPPQVDVRVERVPYEDAQDLRVAWLLEDFPTLDTGDYFDHAREVSMARNVEVFAVRDGGFAVAFAELERPGDGAEIASVYVHPAHRGAGLGTALTHAAIEAAAGARDLWIVTDANGRARQIYERLGFRDAWMVLDFLLLPPE